MSQLMFLNRYFLIRLWYKKSTFLIKLLYFLFLSLKTRPPMVNESPVKSLKEEKVLINNELLKR
mgnify:CR=1 FL=1